jgi:hypothetical protein
MDIMVIYTLNIFCTGNMLSSTTVTHYFIYVFKTFKHKATKDN